MERIANEQGTVADSVSDKTIKKTDFLMGNFKDLCGDSFKLSFGGKSYKVRVDQNGELQVEKNE